MFSTNSILMLGLILLIICINCNSVSGTQLFIALALSTTFSDCFNNCNRRNNNNNTNNNTNNNFV